jgi:YfiH family protein
MVIGLILILVGIVGLVLPVLQGWLLIFLGLSLIAPQQAERITYKALRKLFKRPLFLVNAWKKDGVQAGYTTRHFPLVLHHADELRDKENQKKFIELLKSPAERFVVLNQVHGDEIAVLTGKEKFSEKGFYHVPQCDAVITNIEAMTLLVFTADCLSIFFLAGPWVGLAHAGWRGSQKKIAAKTFQLLVEKSGVKPEQVRIFFGPSIGVKHYEVSEEFKKLFPASALVEKKQKVHLNLSKENERQLLEMGANPKNITNHAICTFSENKTFYSFRKEKDTAGRIISFITKLQG